MGLFEEQLKTRQENDRETVERSLRSLGSAVYGKHAPKGMHAPAGDAVQEILAYFKAEAAEPPSLMTDFDDRLEFMLGQTGIMRRKVTLSEKWWKEAYGPMLAVTKSGGRVALLPQKFGGYGWNDDKTGEFLKANAKTAELLTGEAICFYKPLPAKSLRLPDLIRFMVEALDLGDLLFFFITALIVSLLGMVTPWVTRLIFGTVIPMDEMSNLVPVAVLAVGVLFSSVLMTLTKEVLMARISQKMNQMVENASMARVLNLPAQFFKEHNAGEMQSRVSVLTQICSMLCGTLLTSAVGVLFSVFYLFQITSFAPALIMPSLLILLVQLVSLTASVLMQVSISRKKLNLSAKMNGLVFRLFSGIQKIKLAGAEKRAFAKWAEEYSKEAELTYNPPMLLKIQPALSGLITLGGSLLLYYCAASAKVSSADYMAFTASYGMVSGAMLALAGVAEAIANLRPLMELAEPILKAVPEVGNGKKALPRMSGSIELSNVSFRYTEDSPYVLDHVSLRIPSGQYVAIVGRTGCGKSTLMRLLLGFETPSSGAVYYDGRDLQTLELRALRRKIGVVLQQSRLFSGDIYSNIVISAPWLTQADAWEAAKLAGVDEDIRKMPMGMQTLISEGSGGISGGQRQRIMIARAIAPKPKILMFDEATSALDNITQRVVSDSLDSLKCTRIVIAHRLSTIRACDRILVLDGGKIVEDGTYNELLSRGGFFSELVKRQTILPVTSNEE